MSCFFVITNNIFCSDVECAAELRDFNSLTNFGPGVNIQGFFISSLLSDPSDMNRVSRLKRDTVLQC